MPNSDELNDVDVFDDFDEGAVDILNNIIGVTGAEIVISSDWKQHMTLDGMCEF